MKKILLGLLFFTQIVFGSNVIPDGSITAVKLGAPAPYDALNYTMTATVATNALTISLKTNAGTDPTGRDLVKLGFRSATATSGSLNDRTVTGALSIVIPSGTTIGMTSAVAGFIYVYAMDNAGTVVLAVSLNRFDSTTVQSSSSISGGSSGSTLYSTSAQSSLPIKMLGKIKISETTAGTWAAGPTNINLQNSAGEATNSAVSSDITFSTTSTTAVDVTNSTVTFTTGGRPVVIMLIQPTSTGSSFFTGVTWAATTANTRYEFLMGILLNRDGSQVYGDNIFDVQAFSNASTASGVQRVPGSIIWYDTPTAGTHTYKLQQYLSVSTNLTTAQAQVNGRLQIYELP